MRITQVSQVPIYKGIPDLKRVDQIRLSLPGIFELSDKECAHTRRFLYGINKDGIRRYRTMRDGNYLYVWRIK